MRNDSKLRDSIKKWENETLLQTIKRFPEREENFKTISGIPIKRFYTPLDLQDLNYEKDLGFPGEFPFTRGVQPTGYRGRFWTMRQYSGFATAQETNKRFHFLLEQGQTGLSIAFDLPTQIGYDSDDPLTQGEVGKVGVAIDSLADMEVLFEGIPLDKVSTSMTINAPASILLAMYIVVAEKQGVSMDKLRGTIQNDILKEYVARGTYIFPPTPSMRLITDIFKFCSQNIPLWNTISISGYHIREAGSTAVQEVAFTLADGIAYVQAAINAGLDVDGFASRLSFFFGSHSDFLEEICKFRAARRMWARIMRERFNAKNDDSCRMRFHTQTAGCTLTAQQPDNNVVRVTLQALQAVLGGTQSLHTNSRDEALSLPTEESVQIALRTQQIIAYESGVGDTIDPFAGSYYIESLTNEIEEKAMEYIQKIDDIGGAQIAIEKGFIQREIHEAAYQFQKSVDETKRIVVGVNKFTVDEEPKFDYLRINPEAEREQLGELEKIRSKRNTKQVSQALSALREAAMSDTNLMPSIIDAVRVYATLGEICGVLREIFGEYKAPDIL
ncbi:MAG: methylmalonyl-CoA mutase [Candidatus Thorarchaeota archaeon SMTZ-45]|nr:MAG: methylmalonyl-CoA mutase [Candidatus Thorarchaeota archaeon SMTZ-45]